MATIYDVPADDLIDAVAERLADELEEPDWATVAKAGADRELPPEGEDFWHRRAASVLRRIAVDGPVGIERLTTYYGGGKEGTDRYGVAPVRRVDGSGSLIREIVQDLADAGYVEEAPGDQGRVVTGEGQRFLDRTAGDVLEELDRPDLERYA